MIHADEGACAIAWMQNSTAGFFFHMSAAQVHPVIMQAIMKLVQAGPGCCPAGQFLRGRPINLRQIPNQKRAGATH